MSESGQTAQQGPTAILLIAHGSRLREANLELERVAAGLRARGHYEVVQVSYLELAEPDIESAGALCIERGASRVILLPYFLSTGKHVVEDLAGARARLSGRFPHASFLLADPIGPHSLLLDVLEERAAQAASQ